MDEELRQTMVEVREMKKMCGNINMKLTNIVTQRGQDFKKKLEAEYQRGLEDGKAIHDKGCKGCKYKTRTALNEPCVRCSNAYKSQWCAEADKIEFGDEVERYLNGKLDSTGIYLGEDGDYWNCLFLAGAVFGTFAYPKNQFKKTGRHFDIASILEDMRK